MAEQATDTDRRRIVAGLSAGFAAASGSGATEHASMDPHGRPGPARRAAPPA